MILIIATIFINFSKKRLFLSVELIVFKQTELDCKNTRIINKKLLVYIPQVLND